MKVAALTYALVLPLVSFCLPLNGRSSAQQTVLETQYGIGAAHTKNPGTLARTLLAQAGTPFSSKEGRFSITLPTGFPSFKHKEETQPTAVGNIEVHTYISETSNGACVVGYSDFPAVSFEGRSAQKVLEDGRDGALKAMATLEKQESRTVQGYPGLAFYAKGGSDGISLYARFEYVLVKPRLYQLGYLAFDRAGLDKPEIQAYFKSFRLED